MRKDNIVQFVTFETILGTEAFISQWEQYRRSVNSDLDVTLQQSRHKNLFRYVAQHLSSASELQFVFSRTRKPSHTPEVEIKSKQAGGYAVLQADRTKGLQTGESKLLVFISDPRTDLAVFKTLDKNSCINIYEAYYENCQYAYILEYFVKDKYVEEMLEKLKAHTTIETGTYKQCLLHAVHS